MIDHIEEAKFAKLRKICIELNVPSPPEIHIRFLVQDKNGVPIFDDLQRAHSWTRNYYNLLAFAFGCVPLAGSSFGAGYMTQRTINSTIAATLYGNNSNFPGSTCQTAAGDDNCGIIVGSDETACSVDFYCLQNRIRSGSSAGTLAYQASVAGVGVYTSATKTWTASLSRIFNNNSGSSITIKEAGLYTYSGGIGTMVERSVLSPTVPVPNAAQLTVTYQISMDFSAIDLD